MGRALFALLISCSILVGGPPAWAAPLEQRIELWPNWTLPAPLSRPSSRNDLVYPQWFDGLWQVESVDLDALDQPALIHEARFISDSQNRLVGDRAFNANAIGRALLGEQLLRVEDDPKSSNRQMAQLTGDRRLETTVTGRQQLSPNANTFLADELVLQILHAPGPPRLSQVETLSRYQRCGSDICAEQWQGIYSPPGENLRGKIRSSHHYKLRFTPLPTSAPST